MTVKRSLRDILYILELPFSNLSRSRLLSVVGVSFCQYIPVHLQHKILDQLWWAKQNNHNDYFALATTVKVATFMSPSPRSHMATLGATLLRMWIPLEREN